MITFRVDGTPAPKGSTKAFVVWRRGKGMGAAVTDDNPNTRPWAALVRDAAAQALARSGWRGGVVYPRPMAVRLLVVFVMPRTTRLAKTKQPPHVVKPDLDKLLRALKDALSGVVWEDDSQVIEVACGKCYAQPGQRPGAIVRTQDAQTDKDAWMGTYLPWPGNVPNL